MKNKMRIEHIKEEKAGRCIIYLEDGLSFPLGKKEIKNLDLSEGSELRPEQLEWILDELVFVRGRNYLICLLASRDYTTKEIEQKLIKAEYPDCIIERVLSYGLEKRYLDDYRYASDYIRVNQGRKSVRQLMYQLEEKGIDSSILGQIEAEDDKEELFPKVKRYYEKKQGTPYEKSAKTCQYFMRKGYSLSLIKELIREL